MGPKHDHRRARQGRRGTGAGRRGAPGEGSATRRRILQIALTLMAQRGVDGTSMRDLASAAGLNVASLYHYFPSKRDLLEAVLVEQGFLPDPRRCTTGADGAGAATADPSTLAQLLAEIIDLDVRGRGLRPPHGRRGDARRGHRPRRRARPLRLVRDQHRGLGQEEPARPRRAVRAPPSVARLLSAMVVGIFVQHAAGVLGEEGG